MKNSLRILSVCLLATGVAQADVATLDLAATGNYLSATNILTAQSVGGATFDISYTIGSVSGAGHTNSFVRSNSSQYGVGSDQDIAAHYTTLEGNDGEGISFTGLQILNFNAGTSGYVIGDIENLTFSSIIYNNVANNQDGVNVSFTDFGVSTANQSLNAANTGGTPYTMDLTALGNYGGPETSVYLKTDNTASTNRWAVEGIEVSYTIPEPATLGLVASCAFGVLFIRRRFMM